MDEFRDFDLKFAAKKNESINWLYDGFIQIFETIQYYS